MLFLYRKNGGEILGVSVDAAAYAGIDGTYFGTQTDPTLTDGADLVPPKIWTGSVVRNATAPELATFVTAKATDDNLQARAAALAMLQTGAQTRKALKALVSTLVVEINALRGLVIGTGSVVWDPASMANATGLTSANITVTGAAFGDYVEVAASGSQQGVIANAYVSAANTVVIRLHNGTGSAVNLPNLTWTVCVRRDVAMAARTDTQAFTAIQNLITAGTYD